MTRSEIRRFLLVLGVGILVLIALSGCEKIGAARTILTTVSQKSADTLLEEGVITVCDRATAGALRRKYTRRADGYKAWAFFCEVGR